MLKLMAPSGTTIALAVDPSVAVLSAPACSNIQASASVSAPALKCCHLAIAARIGLVGDDHEQDISAYIPPDACRCLHHLTVGRRKCGGGVDTAAQGEIVIAEFGAEPHAALALPGTDD